VGEILMSKFHKYIILLSLFMIITLFYFCTQVKAEIILSIIDPAGDDYGTGNYTYPQADVFQKGKGLFDITAFNIIEETSKYEFQLKFNELIDVWDSTFGFSLPLIEIYIDNAKGGSFELFSEGANVKLNPAYCWNKLLKINGWWVSLNVPNDKSSDLIDLIIAEDDLPWIIKNPEIEVKDNWIKLKVDKEKIGSLDGSYLYIMVGGFDPFGYNYYRGVKNGVDHWFFNLEGEKNTELAPRVIDLIVPPEYNQYKLLSRYENDYPQIEPVYVKRTEQKTEQMEQDYYTYFAFFVLLFVLVNLMLNIIKRRSGVKEDDKEKE